MFLSCGDSLYDMFLEPDSTDNLRVVVNGITGGSPMNVALGLSRMGHQSAYFTKLSSDVFGQCLTRFLKDNNVDTSLCLPTDRNTTLAFIIKQPDGSANYSFYINGTADVSVDISELPVQLPEAIRTLHFGSYSTAVGNVAESLKALAKREHGKRFISYDPNLRLAIEPDLDIWRTSFKAFASTATLIKASDEDIEGLFGKNNEEKFATECFDLGASIVYITRGAEGASVYTSDSTHVTAKSQLVEVKDTVGAGDTFQASVLHWMAAHNHIADDGSLSGTVDAKASLEFALKAAAVTCSRFGADLPTLDDVLNS